ncbi:MAG: DUF4129 domain-containing protein [Planctomycetota bacterium]|jgi:hypothetical protein|nr:DUF4129 domain-containing protein [Planctomycetota bacterium]
MTRIWCVLLCLIALAVVPGAEATDVVPPVITPSEQAADPARTALRDQQPLWYDAEADDWRRVEIAKPKEKDKAEYEGGGAGSMTLLPILLYGLIFAVLIGMVVWLLVSAKAPVTVDIAGSQAAIRIKAELSDLPFSVTDTGDPEGALAQAMRDQEWGAALIWLFACWLLILDAHGVIHLHRSKTNRCYLRELDKPDERAALEAVVVAFERYYFGGSPPSRDTVEELHVGYMTMRRTVEPGR